MDHIHSQLAQLLDNAQRVLAESGATVNGYPHDYGKMSAAASQPQPAVYSLVAMQAEIRTIEFWRSIFAECVATFFFVVIVCSVTTSSNENDMQINCALASGLAAAMLTLAFARVSGAHLNPAVTFAMMVVRQISPLRATLYMSAQCGGGIAGAALVQGIYKRLTDPVLQQQPGAFGMEFVLTFLIVYAFCATRADARAKETPTNTSHSSVTNGTIGQPYGSSYHAYGSGNSGYRTTATTTYNSQPTVISMSSARPDPLMVGVAYTGCLLAWKGCLNPARALGSAFVSKTEGSFDQHWVLWVGPLLGAITGGFAFEYIFSTRRRSFSWDATTTTTFGASSILNTGTTGTANTFQAATIGTTSQTNQYGNEVDISMQNQDDLEMMDDLERAKQYKSNIMQDFNDRQSMYSSRTYGKSSMRYDDGVYGGTKSLYNQPVGYNDKIYDGTKSCYSGYEGTGANRNNSNMRRSRSIHAKLPPRRDPYDYLPDEPQTMLNDSGGATSMVGNKPDIMQSVGMDVTDPRR